MLRDGKHSAYSFRGYESPSELVQGIWCTGPTILDAQEREQSSSNRAGCGSRSSGIGSIALRPAACERVVAQGRDVEDRRLHPAVPSGGQGQFPVHRVLRDDPLVEGVTEIINYWETARSLDKSEVQKSLDHYTSRKTYERGSIISKAWNPYSAAGNLRGGARYRIRG